MVYTSYFSYWFAQSSHRSMSWMSAWKMKKETKTNCSSAVFWSSPLWCHQNCRWSSHWLSTIQFYICRKRGFTLRNHRGFQKAEKLIQLPSTKQEHSHQTNSRWRVSSTNSTGLTVWRRWTRPTNTAKSCWQAVILLLMSKENWQAIQFSCSSSKIVNGSIQAITNKPFVERL